MRTTKTLNRFELFPKGNSKDAFLIPIGDLHVGAPTCNKEKFEKTVKYAIKKGAYVIGMGDYIENATRYSVGSGVYIQDMSIEDQVDYTCYWYGLIHKAGLLVGMHSGNHEDRSMKDSGIDITAQICKRIGCKYLGFSAYHYLKCGNQSYDVFSTHGASGAKKPYTKIKAAFDLFNIADVELVLMGHVHAVSADRISPFKPDRKNKTVRSMEKVAVLTGSFLEYSGSYADQKNMEPCKTGVAKIMLGAKEHNIHVSV